MTIESPILGLVVLPLVIAMVVLAHRMPTQASRWMLRASALFLLAGAAGVGVQWNRMLKIAVLVDVSSSTRGATFRDPKAVVARLTPLLNGRPYSLHYFGDGLQASADELAIGHTRLEAPSDADVIVLMSDGRFDAPANLSPVYPVIDPALDHPNDGRVDAISVDRDAVTVSTSIVGSTRELAMQGIDPQHVSVAPGHVVVRVTREAKAQSVTAELNGGDLWPENDRMTLSTLPPVPTARWAIGMDVPGFTSLAPSPLSADLANYLQTSVIVLSTDAKVSDAAADHLKQYVTELGGTLICCGPMSELPAALRTITPLISEPPTPIADWTVLLDVSGSMGTEEGGRSRWQFAIDAAERAVGRLSATDRVTVMTFSRSVETVADHVTPANAAETLHQLAQQQPAGSTGLRSALDALASASKGRANRVLLITDADADLGDVAAMAKQLSAAHVTLFAVTTTASEPIKTITAGTGGRVVVDASPADWSTTFESLATSAETPNPMTDATTATAKGVALHIDQCWPAWTRQGADVLADIDSDPIVADWQNGAGRVVSVSVRCRPDELAALAERLEQPPSDARYATEWDESHEHVRVTANDGSGPINGLQPTLRRGDTETAMEQVAPGTYEAALPRQSTASIASIRINNHVISRRAIAGHYAHEFDQVGNDVETLTALANRTGGSVIKPGDTNPIAFGCRTIVCPMASACAVLAFACLGGAIILARRHSSA